MYRLPIFFLLIFSLAACAEQKLTIAVEPEGRLLILDTKNALPSGLAVGILPKDWVSTTSNDVVKQSVSIIVQDGIKALQVITNPEKFSIVRRTNAMLLATPYLNWSWNLSPHGPGTHPIRLIIGFQNGETKVQSTWKQYVSENLGKKLPKFDRTISITWEESALQRGTLSILTLKDGKLSPRYIVRGGRENYGKWWSEFVDLGDLYNQVWPNDNMSRVKINFIGVATSGEKTPTTGYLSKIILTR